MRGVSGDEEARGGGVTSLGVESAGMEEGSAYRVRVTSLGAGYTRRGVRSVFRCGNREKKSSRRFQVWGS